MVDLDRLRVDPVDVVPLHEDVLHRVHAHAAALQAVDVAAADDEPRRLGQRARLVDADRVDPAVRRVTVNVAAVPPVDLEALDGHPLRGSQGEGIDLVDHDRARGDLLDMAHEVDRRSEGQGVSLDPIHDELEDAVSLQVRLVELVAPPLAHRAGVGDAQGLAPDPSVLDQRRANLRLGREVQSGRAGAGSRDAQVPGPRHAEAGLQLVVASGEDHFSPTSLAQPIDLSLDPRFARPGNEGRVRLTREADEDPAGVGRCRRPRALQSDEREAREGEAGDEDALEEHLHWRESEVGQERGRAPVRD